MAIYSNSSSTGQTSSQRGLALILALISAVILSPLHVTKKNETLRFYEKQWSSGFVLPMVLGGLIIAIRTTSTSSSLSSSSVLQRQHQSFLPCSDPSWVLRIGSSSWGLAGILVMLMLVLSWQEHVQEFLWR